MDKIELLESRKRALLEAGKEVRNQIKTLIDEDSFVELSAFSFSKSEFYGEDAQGEGVVTGYATIEGYPYYIVAQNAEVLKGGLSKANCEKITKCLDMAQKNATDVIYILNCAGIRVGEGLNALEGFASVLSKATQLRGEVVQYAVVTGDVLGQAALLTAICDFTFFTKKSVVAANSPLVISAKSGKNVAKEKVGGYDALTNANIATFVVDDLAQVKEKIYKINDILETRLDECEDLNSSIPVLNQSSTVENIEKVFDKGSVVELGETYSKEVKCYLARIGGISVAAVVFDGEKAVELNAQNTRKLADFAQLASLLELPYITFVNNGGIVADMNTNNSLVLKEVASYLSATGNMQASRISVVYKNAIGLGYTLFASKSSGLDYVVAFANSKIALFESKQGAEIEFGADSVVKPALAAKYDDEVSDPVNAAKNGYIDDIIEPQFVRQYLISVLQMSLN